MGGCQSIGCGSNLEYRISYELQVKCSTWTKEASFLYDYTDSKQVEQEQFKITGPGFLVRKEHKASFEPAITGNDMLPNDGEVLLNVRQDEKGFVLDNICLFSEDENFANDNEKALTKMPWLVAKPHSNAKNFEGYRLHENDIIRLGKVKFRLKKKFPDDSSNFKGETEDHKITLSHSAPTNRNPNDLRLDTDPVYNIGISELIVNQSTPRTKNPYFSPVHRQKMIRQRSLSTPLTRTESLGQAMTPRSPGSLLTFADGGAITDTIKGNANIKLEFEPKEGVTETNKQGDADSTACRICLDEEETPENPILQPCHCAGTMKNVHLFCFKEWISRQLTQKKSANLLSIVWKKLRCELCNTECDQILEKDGKEYELIEMPVIDTPHIILEYFISNKSLGYHILKFTKDKPIIVFGRGNTCDIRVNDNTVSRMHCLVAFKQGSFYLQDLGSRFGSSILLDRPSELLTEHNQFLLQVGRSILECRLLKIKTPLPKNKSRKNQILPQLSSKGEEDVVIDKKSMNNPSELKISKAILVNAQGTDRQATLTRRGPEEEEEKKAEDDENIPA